MITDARAGRKEPLRILALHGWTDNAGTWDLFAPLLVRAATRTLISTFHHFTPCSTTLYSYFTLASHSSFDQVSSRSSEPLFTFLLMCRPDRNCLSGLRGSWSLRTSSRRGVHRNGSRTQSLISLVPTFHFSFYFQLCPNLCNFNFNPIHPYNSNLKVHDVVDTLEQLRWKKCVLMGHSMGGIIAMYVAAAVPDRIEYAFLRLIF